MHNLIESENLRTGSWGKGIHGMTAPGRGWIRIRTFLALGLSAAMACSSPEKEGRGSAFNPRFPSPWLQDTAWNTLSVISPQEARTPPEPYDYPPTEPDMGDAQGLPPPSSWEMAYPEAPPWSPPYRVAGSSGGLNPDENYFPSLPSPTPEREISSDPPRWERLEKTIERLHELHYPPHGAGDTPSVPWTWARVEAASHPGEVGQTREEVSGFYGLSVGKEQSGPGLDKESFPAEVYEDSRIEPGSWVGIRLRVPLVVDGVPLPEGIRVFGRARASGDRLELTIHSLRFGDQIKTVRLDLYDQDGQKGFYVPDKRGRLPDPGRLGSIWPLKRKWTDMILQGESALSSLRNPPGRPMRVHVPARYRVYLVPHPSP